LAYELLILQGEEGVDGALEYREPRQVALLIEGLRDEGRGTENRILSRIHLVDVAYVPEVLDALVPLLDSADHWIVFGALQAHVKLAAATPAAVESARRYLIDPATANPAMWEDLKLNGVDYLGQSSSKRLRSAAASVLLLGEGLDMFLAGHPELDVEGRSVCARALLGWGIRRDGFGSDAGVAAQAVELILSACREGAGEVTPQDLTLLLRLAEQTGLQHSLRSRLVSFVEEVCLTAPDELDGVRARAALIQQELDAIDGSGG
jgi:hypothetical protein